MLFYNYALAYNNIIYSIGNHTLRNVTIRSSTRLIVSVTQTAYNIGVLYLANEPFESTWCFLFGVAGVAILQQRRCVYRETLIHFDSFKVGHLLDKSHQQQPMQALLQMVHVHRAWAKL